LSMAPSDNPHPKGSNSAPPLCQYKISFSNEIEARNLDLLSLIADDFGSPLFVPVHLGEQEVLVFIEMLVSCSVFEAVHKRKGALRLCSESAAMSQSRY